MSNENDDDLLRRWIVRALRDGDAEPIVDHAAVVLRASQEGVLPLVEWRLRTAGNLDKFPSALREALVQGARTAAKSTLYRDAQLKIISANLARAGIECLLLKGPAFAGWLYPQRYLRVSGDVDLLFVSREVAEHAAELLATVGFQRAFFPSSMTYEMTSRLQVDGVTIVALDIHSRLVNVPAYADIFSFADLWNSSVSIPLLGQDMMRALDPLHSLVHACVHRAVDLYLREPPRLKWIYDIHLMASHMDDEDWTAFLHLVKAKQVAGVCLRSILDAVTTFSSPVPSRVIEALSLQGASESLDWRRLDDWRYMQLRNVKALPTNAARMRWLWERLVPSKSHLHELHGDGNWALLMWRRATRGVRRLRNQS